MKHYMARILPLALALAIVAPTSAHALSGTASLEGFAKLVVKGCGAHRTALSATLLVASDGTWSAQSSDADSFTGTYTTVGRSGRKLRLTVDDPSAAALVASVAEDIAILCDTPPVTVTSSRPKAVTLALDRTLQKAKLVVRWVLKGSAGGRSGTATYKVQARGAWIPS
jgi:hypothetical protein